LPFGLGAARSVGTGIPFRALPVPRAAERSGATLRTAGREAHQLLHVKLAVAVAVELPELLSRLGELVLAQTAVRIGVEGPQE
jgi:hypothetical protein